MALTGNGRELECETLSYKVEQLEKEVINLKNVIEQIKLVIHLQVKQG